MVPNSPTNALPTLKQFYVTRLSSEGLLSPLENSSPCELHSDGI